MCYVDTGIKPGLIIELVHASTALPIDKIFPTSQQVAKTPTRPSSLLPQPLPSDWLELPTALQLKG